MDPMNRSLKELDQMLLKEAMEKSCEEMSQKMINVALKDIRSTGEVLGIVASTAIRDESVRASFLAKVKKELETGIETTLNMSDAHMFMHVFRKSMKLSDKNLGEFMEALKL